MTKDLFGNPLPDPNASNAKKKRATPKRNKPTPKPPAKKEKTQEEIEKDKAEFLKELQEMPTAADEANAEQDELQKLQDELAQDEAEGLLVDEPFYVKDKKLYVRRYQDQVQANIANLAKGIIDRKWNQNINPKNIEVVFDLTEDGQVVYEKVVCTSDYGVRFHTILSEILEKLNKIPFE